MGIQNPTLYFLKMTVWTTKVQFPCLWTDLTIFSSSLTWKFDEDSKSDNVLSLKTSLDHKSQISCLWTDLTIFSSSLTWKFDWDPKSDIVLHLKWFTGPQNSIFFQVNIYINGKILTGISKSKKKKNIQISLETTKLDWCSQDSHFGKVQYRILNPH